MSEAQIIVRIPFKLPKFSDWDEGDGFMYLDGDLLVIEYYILNLGLLRSKAHFVKAERAVVKGFETHREWFRDRLIVETTSIQLMQEVPGKHTIGVELKTKRKDREVVDQFVELANAWVDGVGPGRLRAGG